MSDERTMTTISLSRPSRVITVSLGTDATKEAILHCVREALDMDAGLIPSEHTYECWMPQGFKPPEGAPTT